MEQYNAYIGMDVHKEKIAIAVAYPGTCRLIQINGFAKTEDDSGATRGREILRGNCR